MPRRQMYFKWEVPQSVVAVVNAICADYNRRDKAIKGEKITGEVLEKYVELNAMVDKALDDIEPGVRKEILRDITEGRGYNKSGMQIILSKNAYYRRRRKLVHDIAKDLALL